MDSWDERYKDAVHQYRCSVHFLMSQVGSRHVQSRIFLHFFIDHVSLPKKIEVNDMSNDASVHRHNKSLVLSDDVQTSLFSMRCDFREAGGHFTQLVVTEILRGLIG